MLYISWEADPAPWYLVDEEQGVAGLFTQSARYFLICYQVCTAARIHLFEAPSIDPLSRVATHLCLWSSV